MGCPTASLDQFESKVNNGSYKEDGDCPSDDSAADEDSDDEEGDDAVDAKQGRLEQRARFMEQLKRSDGDTLYYTGRERRIGMRSCSTGTCSTLLVLCHPLSYSDGNTREMTLYVRKMLSSLASSFLNASVGLISRRDAI